MDKYKQALRKREELETKLETERKTALDFGNPGMVRLVSWMSAYSGWWNRPDGKSLRETMRDLSRLAAAGAGSDIGSLDAHTPAEKMHAALSATISTRPLPDPRPRTWCAYLCLRSLCHDLVLQKFDSEMARALQESLASAEESEKRQLRECLHLPSLTSLIVQFDKEMSSALKQSAAAAFAGRSARRERSASRSSVRARAGAPESPLRGSARKARAARSPAISRSPSSTINRSQRRLQRRLASASRSRSPARSPPVKPLDLERSLSLDGSCCCWLVLCSTRTCCAQTETF